MKKSTLALFSVLLLIAAAPAFAETSGTKYSADGSLGFGSGPANYDTGFSFNFGFGYSLDGILKDLQARIDVSYFDFGRDYYGVDLEYTRVPITFSARYSFPVTDQLKPFVQAGIETSVDDKEVLTGWYKERKSEVNVGLSPGGGIAFFITPNASIFALGRIHIIDDSYFSMHFGGAFHF
jgi:opacity protein-like surface antigen